MAQLMSVRLSKGDSPNLGFRLQGGKDFGTPLVIQKVNGGSPAEKAGLIAGDAVIKINNTDVFNLRHKDAQEVIVRSGPAFEVTVQRGGSTWKPSVVPQGNFPSHQGITSNVSPVTKTSLAAQNQSNIGAIGTGHNLAAKPFAPQQNGNINGGPKLVNKQYNTPVGLYSEESIAETLSAQTEVLATGALGVNFKKNEKNFDISKSAVLSVLQEAEKEPSRDYETEADSGIVSAPSQVAAGLRHVIAPETRPAPPTPQLPPGQNICADCERLIVGVFVRIKDKNLHVECFKCSTCGCSLKNVGYYNINQKLYCDIHAKLAAKNNPPAPNLVPVTLPPANRAPAGTISAALGSHSHPLPSPAAPLSPHLSNTSAAPYQTGSNFGGPRPFASVISPLSPALNNYSQPSLPQANFPRNPAPVAPSVISPPIAATPERGRLVENVVWPPISETESEVPTASPLYFPPPSQVHVQHILKVTDHDVTEVYQPWGNPRVPEPADKTDEDYNELEEYNALMSNSDPKMSLCSAEVLGITGRRSAVECAESLSTALETAMLIDNVMKNRPKTPPPVDADVKISEPQKAKVETTAKSVCPCKNSCCNETCDSCPMRPPSELRRPADYQPKEAVKSPPKSPSKVINCVPQKYESPMVQALKVASDTPYGQQDFSQIPSKSSSTGFATALTIAPTEPFSVVPTVFTNREPIPLPEETEPYFPPEHHYVSEPKPAAKVQQDIPEKPDSPFVDALKVAPDRPFTPQGGSATPTVRKKKPQPDPLLKDLPKSHEILTMRSALTVASDRTYSPLTIDLMQTCKEQTVVCQQRKHVEEQRKTPVKQTVLQPFVPIMPDCFLPVNDSHENPPTNFPPITDELRQTAQYKADYSEIKSEISSQIYEQTQMAEYSEEQIQQQQAFIAKQEAVCQKQSSTGRIERQSEQTVYKKPLNLSQSLHKPDYLPQYQASLEYDEVIELPHHKNINNLLQPKSRVVPDQRPLNTLRPENPYPARTPPPPQVERRPVNTVQQGHHVPSTHIFQPVHEEERPNSESFSTRNPRPITPSMINKPAAAIPYYQTNLVASQCLAPESQVFDPKSPATSRSPSPCPGSGARSSSPFPRASPRAKSPAPGPPPNPLKKEQVPAPPQHHVTFDQNSQLRERAKDNLSSFLPQYKERMERTPIPQINLHQDSCSLVESSQSERTVGNVSISERQQHEERQRKEAASRHNVVQQGNVTKSISERALLEEQQRRNQSEVNTVERSADNSVQIQRKKVVTEEFEHVHKEKNIEIQTSGSSDQYFKTYPFQNVNVPKTEEHGISGLHVTNPHAITSPFLGNAPSKAHVVTQPISNPVVVKPAATVPQATNKQAPIAVKPASASVPSQFRPVVPPIVPPKSVAGTSQNVNSSCGANLPDLGAAGGGAGGKQAGAVPFSPKRGRGVLNVGGIGSRAALCGSCHSQIRGPFISALGKIWCPDHFVCATPSCKRPLQDLGFVEEQGKLYCEYCFEQYLAPNCSKCNGKIKADCLRAIGKHFHPECFKCTYCSKMFGNNPFFLEDGLPYCQDDWNELFTTKCFACGFPVEAGDRWVEALNNNYHTQCFNCSMCKKNLEGQSFFAKGGRPFCKNHAR